MWRLYFIFLLSFTLPLIAHSQQSFEEGRDYFTYQQPIPYDKSQDKRILIQYFFDYDCRVCSAAQDILELYSQINRDKVRVEERPIAIDKSLFSAKVFYSLVAVHAEELSPLLLFETSEKQRYTELSHLPNLLQWLEEQGVDKDEFLQAYQSPEVAKAVQQASLITEEYGVFTFPYVIIDGRYVLTASTLYSDDYSFAVLDYLLTHLK